ncbi:MAG: peptidase T [Phycisphaerales bacterium]|nr:peptidase T [Phycisphaerales bacterium]
MSTMLDRFCRYVKIESTAVEDAGRYPSSDGQFDMTRLLTKELKELGIADAEMADTGVVMGTLPATTEGAPTIAWLAHVDTSPEYTGKNVKPIVHENYDGKDIVLPGDPTKVIKVSECDELATCKGKTLITTDGTTLLGADDKAGVTVIMETVAYLLAHPEIKHGPIRICFTCDEEIGHGVDHVDIKKLGAIAAYTLDGEGEGYLENETFSADLATVTVTGVNIHPGYAKGKMTNALHIAAKFLERMPTQGLSPETTSGREGFLHPYVIEGGVPEVKIKILLRDFVTAKLADKRAMLDKVAAGLNKEFPTASVKVVVTEQYRNMADWLNKEPRAVELAKKAYKAIGLEPNMSSIRGGTDGSRLTEMGLPTPNLSTGMHNFHSPLEWACLEEMQTAQKLLVEIAKAWGEEKA